jgi:hypothetical protein
MGRLKAYRRERDAMLIDAKRRYITAIGWSDDKGFVGHCLVKSQGSGVGQAPQGMASTDNNE